MKRVIVSSLEEAVLENVCDYEDPETGETWYAYTYKGFQISVSHDPATGNYPWIVSENDDIVADPMGGNILKSNFIGSISYGYAIDDATYYIDQKLS